MQPSEQDILSDYNALDITVPPDFFGWMRSNHAGETGAVWIYRGSACVVWSPRIRAMAAEHAETEENHLVVIRHLLPKDQQSWLLPLWRVMGFTLGFGSALFGYRAFCLTVEAVETFVEQHYQEQIDHLRPMPKHAALRQVLERCCAEEVHHQQDALRRLGPDQPIIPPSRIAQVWKKIVGTGSELAVHAAKRL